MLTEDLSNCYGVEGAASVGGRFVRPAQPSSTAFVIWFISYRSHRAAAARTSDTNTRVNRTPFSASASRRGVTAYGSPKHPRSGPMSSQVISKKFGRSGSVVSGCPRASAPGTSTHAEHTADTTRAILPKPLIA